MKTNLRYVFSITMFFLSFSVIGQSDYWRLSATSIQPDNINLQNMERGGYKLFTLDENIFKERLQATPIRTTVNTDSQTVISLPDEKGNYLQFYVFEAPVLARELSQKYPDIKSYIGYSVGDKKIRTRFSVSPFGIQSMIVYPDGHTIFMEKNTRQVSDYIVYERSARLGVENKLVCTTEQSKNEIHQTEVTRFNNDQTLRRYRLAVSTSGEYTTFHGGTVAGALAAINATMTRVNEVFETDLGISLEVIANTDILIFTDAAIDPYGGSLTSELQNTLTTMIGESNYDVGHLFHRAADNGNGGCIGCVCIDGRKGRGFSATTSPTGDTFDIDYVSHELGHQFGGNHTWSFESEGTGVNVEPASGTTIMAYAGITQQNDVQSNSDPYFHYLSILQITNYIATTTCDEELPLSNNPPVADAGSDFIIPRSTAFLLSGTGTDLDLGDVLSYSWEQVDNGVITNTTFGPTNTSGANFRSLPPTDEPLRYMPRLSRILSGNLTQTNPSLNDAWETVSDVSREMNFAFTVRDNVAGGGQTHSDLMRVTVDGNAGPFLVTSQASATNLIAGDVEIVSWDVANTDLPPINTREVDILLSADGGQTFPFILAQNVANDGEHPVIVPGGITTSNARIMVRASDNIFLAVNSAPLSIEQSEIVLQFDELEYALCQPDDLNIDFSFNTFLGFNETTTFSVENAPPNLGINFTPGSAVSNGANIQMTLTNTANVNPGSYTLMVTATGTSVTKQIPLQLFVFGSDLDPVTLNNPVNGATDVFLSQTLSWISDPSAEEYDIEVATDIGFTNIIDAITLFGTSYTVNNLQSNTQYFWRVRSRNRCSQGDFSTVFSFMTSEVNCKTFGANDLPLSISEEGTPTVSSTILVADNIPLTDVKVTLDISHTFIGDLTLSLQSPSGRTVLLATTACDENNNIQATFDDAGGALVCGDDPAISGVIAPEQPLAGFFGESSQGEWTLIVADGFDFDGGTINSFSIELCAGGEFLPDNDNDGVLDEDDNCPLTANADQADNDNDGIGDVCDDDDDNDGILDIDDNCPLTANADQADNDNDGIGDVCDDDDDNDGVLDTIDNCLLTANPDQLDSDNDGIGNSCDTDVLVSEAFTPNGDNINDTWQIVNIERYPNANVSVYNRLGNKVFNAIGYNNDWNGVSNGRSERLPAGSYYYQIDLTGEGTIDLSGWIYITY